MAEGLDFFHVAVEDAVGLIHVASLQALRVFTGGTAQISPAVVDGEKTIEVVHVNFESDSKLLDVVRACGLLSLELGLGQSRQEHPREDRDDGDDDKQFNEGERAAGAPDG